MTAVVDVAVGERHRVAPFEGKDILLFGVWGAKHARPLR